MNTEYIREVLFENIRKVTDNIKDYCVNPEKDFIRNRKFSAERLIKGIIGMKGGSLSNEILDMFDFASDTPTTSAFVQQRVKLKAEAFEAVFRSFTNSVIKTTDDEIPLLAVDGSDVQIPVNPDDVDSYYPGINEHRAFNLLHLNALYNLNHNTYMDLIIQKSRKANEHAAFIQMIDRLELNKAIIMVDRGYESYNNIAHVQEKGLHYIFRIKDGEAGIKQCLKLPKEDTYDIDIALKLYNRNKQTVLKMAKDKDIYQYRHLTKTAVFDYLPPTNAVGEAALYEMHFRIVRFEISENTYETILTNLDRDEYSPERLKELYSRRWGIETSFRKLKLTMGMVNFHSKKMMCICQEIYAHLIIYNFTEMITSHVVIKTKKRKYTYTANFAVSSHVCRKYFKKETTSSDLKAIIKNNIIPIRPDRHYTRKRRRRLSFSFLYRVS